MAEEVKATKSDKAADDVTALIKARNSLIWVVTSEEARVERYLFKAAVNAKYVPLTWDVGQGILNMDGSVKDADSVDADSAFGKILSATKGSDRNVWIMRDLPVWLSGPPMARSLRLLRNLARLLPTVGRTSAQAIIVLSPNNDVPPELAGHATVVEWPLPDKDEIAAILDSAVKAGGDKVESLNGQRDAAIESAVGLTGEEAAACYAKSLVQLKKIDPKVVAQEKKRVITREKVLEWYDPLPDGLDAVGGLENLKQWLVARSNAYTPEARAYGLPLPKGTLIVGIPGTGKSLTAKAVSTAWGIPLLRLDLGALKSKFVGESEANLRKAFKVIEAIGRCVLWIDEIEKALQGATSGSADGGVSADALGTLLSWMQERQSGAFVIATANDVSALPPELLRKGRFDEVFFVDLPNVEERVAIVQAALRANSRKNLKLDFQKIAEACEQFTGSEIAALVPEAMFSAFADKGREIETKDLLAVAAQVVPLATTAKEKIAKLQDWAKSRARHAGKAPEASTQSAVRALDIE